MNLGFSAKPLDVYNKLKWDLHGKPELANDIIDTFRKLSKLPNNLIPKRIKNEIKGAILLKNGDSHKAFNIFIKAYEEYGKNNHYIVLVLANITHTMGNKELYTKFDNLAHTNFTNICNHSYDAVEMANYMSVFGLKNFLTIHEGKHDEARILAHTINEKIAKNNNLTVKYLCDDITEPVLKKIEGPVYTYNNLIIKNKDVLILGTNQDEIHFKKDFYNFSFPDAEEIPDGDNFYYCNPVFENHYHTLIEHIPIYNYVAMRFPNWTYYRLNTIDTLESEEDNYKLINKDKLYLHKNGFYTFILPRTTIPTLFDNFRPPDCILQEYREIIMDVFKPDDSKKRPIIYMSRKRGRELVNDVYMINKLKKIYPELVVFTGNEKTDQPLIFRNAKMIFGPHGAGFSNMIYCPNDCIVYEVGMTVPDNFFGSLARTFNLRYYKDTNIKLNYYCKYHTTNEEFDSLILNIQRLLTH